MIDDIEKYFERFGEINYVEIHHETNTYYGLIEFQTPDAAETVLSIKKHYIDDGHRIEVKEAEAWHQPDHILNALDNHCLRMILSHLNQPDLSNAANACIRFNQQAKAIFATKFKQLNLTHFSNREAKIALQTFGPLAQSIDINSFHRFEIEILILIAQLCDASMLRELKITDFLFRNKLHADIRDDTALTKLERLSLNFCYLKKSAMDFLALCGELKILHLNNCSFYDDIQLPHFHALDELRLDCGIGIGNQHLNEIIAAHPTLRRLSLVQLGYPNVCASRTMYTIGQHLSNLQELEFNMHTFNRTEFAASIICLGKLASLKVLKLNLNSQSADLNVLIAKAIPIERMRLSKGIMSTETFKTIAQMEKLKALELCDIDGLNDENLIELAKGMGPRLEQLQLKESTAVKLTTIGLKKMLDHATKLSFLALRSTTIEIDADDYKAMVSTLRKRPENIGLVIELSGVGDQVEISEKVRMEHCDVLRIDENVLLDSERSSPYYCYESDSSIDLFDIDDFEYGHSSFDMLDSD